jgi:hypothetical protein
MEKVDARLLPKMIHASDLKVGDRTYDPTHHDWLQRWPTIQRIDNIAAERLYVVTNTRVFIFKPDEYVLQQ